MPCNCNYMQPKEREKESKRLMWLLTEVGLHRGEIPYYGDVSNIDYHTAILCEFCQNNDVTQYSLELQIWWRDHQEFDKHRIEKEKNAKLEKDTRAALSKLTGYERKLLGLEDL